MFWGCANLTEAPILSATTLQMGCYAVMFRYCTALTEIPKLPAETIPSWAYCYMFNGCVSLSEPVYLPAKLFYSTFCYAYMFDDCKLIKEIHYPISIESNSTFKSMNGTPWFGATDATVYYDL